MASQLTIAIPSYQRRHLLGALLRSIDDVVLATGVPGVEVLVVLDGSNDGSRELVEAMTWMSPIDARVHWQPNSGLAAARNTLVRLARAPLIWLVDDDMVINAEAMLRHVHHDRSVAPVLMGPCNVVADGPQHGRLAPYYDERHGRLACSGRVTRPQDCSFANTSVPTAILREHRFDERFRGYGLEDTELAVRLLDAGVVIGFDPVASIDHHCRPTTSERLSTMHQAGRNMVRLAAIHPDRLTVAFEPDVRRIERLLRSSARPRTSKALWVGAVAIGWVGARWPGERWSHRLCNAAEMVALYAGVAAAGGVPRGEGRGTSPWYNMLRRSRSCLRQGA